MTISKILTLTYGFKGNTGHIDLKPTILNMLDIVNGIINVPNINFISKPSQCKTYGFRFGIHNGHGMSQNRKRDRKMATAGATNTAAKHNGS